jgi:transcriptional regulator with XRE-family HTH domain
LAKENWAKRIHDARHDRGLSREELAKRAGVALRTIYNLESGTRKPRGSTLRKLLETLKKIPKLADI